MHRSVATEAEIAKAAAELARLVESQAVLVTRSEEGMTLHIEGHAPIHIPAYPVKVRDVSGAGDTVAAVMAVLLAMQAPFESAMRAANAAAAAVVGKRGTATVSLAELRHRILPAASLAPEDKIVFDWAVLDERLAEWRKHGLRLARWQDAAKCGGDRGRPSHVKSALKPETGLLPPRGLIATAMHLPLGASAASIGAPRGLF